MFLNTIDKLATTFSYILIQKQNFYQRMNHSRLCILINLVGLNSERKPWCLS